MSAPRGGAVRGEAAYLSAYDLQGALVAPTPSKARWPGSRRLVYPAIAAGDVAGRECIIIDDIVDSAGTLCNAAVALMDDGAKSVSAYISHGVLSGGAVSRVAASPIQNLVITDSILGTEAVRVSHNVRQLTIAPLIGEAMARISEEKSVSSLFDYSAA